MCGYLLKDLFSGIVLWIPILLAGFILWLIFDTTGEWGKNLLNFFFPNHNIDLGWGIFFFVMLFLLTGILIRKTLISNWLSRIPIWGRFFQKDGKTITITFDKLLKSQPCLFLFSPTCPSYGFIFSEEMAEINDEISDIVFVNVYDPDIPAIITGKIRAPRKEKVILLGNPAWEIIDILFYNRKVPKHLILLPWEGESKEAFRKRAEGFGL
ncbi:MAG: hypothetical protein A2175_01320 [Candidatus Nealsonbacteria bacterium RBG_13_42_11]|uniref:Uncharacterized protein n=1 Tax=Candidatus Nealsonbacteria bacterium RBG_13_42_11 TaxID=1801663 RepID=A0A1G2DZJ1_9BACT|nr:MAG: hypothetical protein A2175_01320 [Candidatus Nealsonbacteria bacterium RBG_13_42_11]